jgi:hypothetical protein
MGTGVSESRGEDRSTQPQGMQLFDASGSLVETIEAARDAKLAAAQAPAGMATSCWELQNGAVRFRIELEHIPVFWGFLITGGAIKSGICGAPWAVVGGWLDTSSGSGPAGTSCRIEAVRLGSGNCANMISIVGDAVPIFAGFRGTYGFNGSTTDFTHFTLWLKYGSCPE